MKAKQAAALFCAAVSAAFGWTGGVTKGTSRAVSRYFERAKANESTLVAFLHKMPKGADLHNHLLGAVEAEDLLDTALVRGLFFDRARKTFVAEAGAERGRYYAAADIVADAAKRAEALEAISMRNAALSGESKHDHFFYAFDRLDAALPDQAALFRPLFARAVSERIGYLEITINVDTPETAAAIDAAKDDALRQFGEENPGWNLDVNYISELYRNAPPEDFKRNLEDGVRRMQDPALRAVGMTMMTSEDNYVSQRDFAEQVAAIDAVCAAYQGGNPPKFSLHAGELTMEYARYASLTNRISESIRLGHASRIDHGTAIMWENDVYGLLKLMRDKGIGVTVCLTSNETILNVSGGDRHPFRLYWDAGVPVALATDDQGTLRSNLTLEYAKAAKWFDLSYPELKWLAYSSLEIAFLPGESLFIGGDFNRIKPDADSVARRSAKARKQRELAQAFAAFERAEEAAISEFGWNKPQKNRR